MKAGAAQGGGRSPLVTVIVPTTGRDELRRAVRSVSDQGVATEVIVVVDRPSALPRVEAMLAGLECAIVASEGGVGSSAARNLGVQRARGEYTAFCDDDDWWAPDKLARQLDAVGAARGRGATVATCAMVFHRRDGREEILPRRTPGPGEGIGDYLVSRARVRFGDGVIQTSCLLVATELMRAARWNESLRLHEDWDLAIRLIEDHGARLVSVAEPVAHVQQGSAHSLSAAPDWRESRRWLDLHGTRLSRTARGDFLAVQIMRAALSRRDREGIAYALRGISRRRPHLAALAVAGLGVVGR